MTEEQWPMPYSSPGEGKTLRLFDGTTCAFRSRGESYTLLESTTSPGGGPPPHIHHAQDEVIYVLEGEYSLVNGNEALTLGPGSLVSIPRGTVHAFKVGGTQPGRCLMLLTPPGPVERFFEEIGVPVEHKDRAASLAPPEVHPEKVLESARRNGIELLITPV